MHIPGWYWLNAPDGSRSNHPSSVSSVTTHLAEGKADTPPAPVDVVSRRTLLHAAAAVLQVPAGHAAAGVARLGAASQALVVAALVLQVTRAMLALVRAHCRGRDEEQG